jgi:hypothetical protein
MIQILAFTLLATTVEDVFLTRRMFFPLESELASLW